METNTRKAAVGAANARELARPDEQPQPRKISLNELRQHSLVVQGDWQAAIDTYQLYLHAKRVAVRIWSNLDAALLKRSQSAVNCYHCVLGLSPDDLTTKGNLANALGSQRHLRLERLTLRCGGISGGEFEFVSNLFYHEFTDHIAVTDATSPPI